MFGSKKQGDPRVQRALDRLGLKYRVDSDGDFVLIFDLGRGRSQQVFINSETYMYAGLEIRPVWSIAGKTDGPPAPELMYHLLLDNRAVKFGSWRVSANEGGVHIITFAAQVAAGADADFLLPVIQMVTEKADELEEMLGGDQY